MSNPGEWIGFEELCRRVPGKSAATLRRLYNRKAISYRQLVKGGRLEFNWRTVERELARLESPGVFAEAVRLEDQPSPAVAAELAALRRLVEAQGRLLEGVAATLGVVPFAGEQRRIPA